MDEEDGEDGYGGRGGGGGGGGDNISISPFSLSNLDAVMSDDGAGNVAS